jgi:hypothetical protein
MSCCSATWKFDAVCGSGCNINHVFEFRVFERLKWLVSSYKPLDRSLAEELVGVWQHSLGHFLLFQIPVQSPFCLFCSFLMLLDVSG